MRLADVSTRTKILYVTCSPVLLLAALGVISLFAISSLTETNKWVDHTHSALRDSTDIVASALDMETGMRGNLLAGREEFLEPYSNGSPALNTQIEALQRRVSDNPCQVQRLAEAGSIIDVWDRQVVPPMITLRRDIGDADTMNDIANMDEMTQQNSALIEDSTASARMLSDQANRLNELMGFFKLDGHTSFQRHSARSVRPKSNDGSSSLLATTENDWNGF